MQQCFISDNRVKLSYGPKITHVKCDSRKLILIRRLDLLKVLCTCQEGSLRAQNNIGRAEPHGKLEEKAAGWTKEETNKRTAEHRTFIAEKKVEEITNSHASCSAKSTGEMAPAASSMLPSWPNAKPTSGKKKQLSG